MDLATMIKTAASKFQQNRPGGSDAPGLCTQCFLKFDQKG